MDFLAHWKNWIRPLASIIYFILMMIAIPLCIIEVTRNDKDKHVKAWFTGGVFVLIAVPVSLWEIIQHVINYTKPHLQKYIIRIMWMVPIYALNAWFALRFKESAIYLDTIRECYEAYVIYNFMAYLLSFLWETHPQLHIDLARKPPQKHLIPFCLLPPWKMGSKMIQYCKHGVLQYTIVRPVTTAIALICELNHKYDEGNFNFTTAWSYLVIINNISQIWAMYCLVLFYKATSDMLAPIKPIPKFLCVKFVVFFSFWQAVLIAALAALNVIPKTAFYDYNVDDTATAIQDFCICIEMMIAAIAHYFAFSHKPFINHEAENGNCCRSFWSMWDVSDVKDDVVEHVKAIGTTMKKTVSGQFRSRPGDTESTPLLLGGQSSTAGTSLDNTQVTTADVHQDRRPSQQADTISCTSDWEVTSVDRWKTQSQGAKSVTASMQNFLDVSSVTDTQSVQSHGADFTASADHRGMDESGGSYQKTGSRHFSDSESDSKPIKQRSSVSTGSRTQSTGSGDTVEDIESEKALIDFENDQNVQGANDISGTAKTKDDENTEDNLMDHTHDQANVEDIDPSHNSIC